MDEINDGRSEILYFKAIIDAERQWIEASRAAEVERREKTHAALRLATQLRKEYNEGKEAFSEKQSAKVTSLLRQFKSIYECTYGAGAVANEAKEYLDELTRQAKLHGYDYAMIQVLKEIEFTATEKKGRKNWFCGECGTLLGSHRFCKHCGADSAMIKVLKENM